MTDERNLPSLTPRQMEALRRFAQFEVSAEDLLRELAGVFEYSFEPRIRIMSGSGPDALRQVSGRFRVPEPGIVITREHIAHALEEKRVGHTTERELVYWASILLANDAYVLDPGDEDLIAEWLNNISLCLGSG